MKTYPAALAATLFLLIAAPLHGHAQGSFVYRDLGSFWLLGAAEPVHRYELDFNEDGQSDFIIEAGEAFQPIGIGNNAVYSYPEPPGDLGALAVPLQFGQAIGPSLPSGAVWFESYIHPSPPNQTISAYFHYVLDGGAGGLWRDGMIAYMGAEFDIDGQTHYGWLRIEIPDPLRGNGGIIHDMAYNTIPGQAILAGQVPEPSTWVLLIGGGALIWWRHQQRRTGLS